MDIATISSSRVKPLAWVGLIGKLSFFIANKRVHAKLFALTAHGHVAGVDGFA